MRVGKVIKHGDAERQPWKSCCRLDGPGDGVNFDRPQAVADGWLRLQRLGNQYASSGRVSTPLGWNGDGGYYRDTSARIWG